MSLWIHFVTFRQTKTVMMTHRNAMQGSTASTLSMQVSSRWVTHRPFESAQLCSSPIRVSTPTIWSTISKKRMARPVLLYCVSPSRACCRRQGHTQGAQAKALLQPYDTKDRCFGMPICLCRDPRTTMVNQVQVIRQQHHPLFSTQ